MYIDLDKFSKPIINPFEKIKLLQEVILKQFEKSSELSLLQIDHQASRQVDHKASSQITQVSQVLMDVANIMEYNVTRQFIEKYFLNWDVSDFVTVLINMYKSLDRYGELTQIEKFSILHNLIEDKQSRRMIASAVSSWKSDVNFETHRRHHQHTICYSCNGST
jgi:uncharacterized protein YjaZ